MNELQIIEHQKQRVLTTAQLAESYGTDIRTISNNFTRNTTRYKNGKHYHKLVGDELKEFKAIHQNDEHLKFAATLYLWTEKGAWLHAKSLNTDEAWDAYEMLVDDYYEVKPQTNLEILQMTVNELTTHDKRISHLEETMRIDGVQEHKLSKLGKQAVMRSLGGYKSPAYIAMSSKLFARFWRDFKNHFMLPRYSELPKVKFDEAVEFIQLWQPDTTTRLEINAFNKQQRFEVI